MGTNISIQDKGNQYDSKSIMINERPTQCALCPIKSSGYHAMHREFVVCILTSFICTIVTRK